jgi:hypothetical protein
MTHSGVHALFAPGLGGVAAAPAVEPPPVRPHERHRRRYRTTASEDCTEHWPVSSTPGGGAISRQIALAADLDASPQARSTGGLLEACARPSAAALHRDVSTVVGDLGHRRQIRTAALEAGAQK